MLTSTPASRRRVPVRARAALGALLATSGLLASACSLAVDSGSSGDGRSSSSVSTDDDAGSDGGGAAETTTGGSAGTTAGDGNETVGADGTGESQEVSRNGGDAGTSDGGDAALADLPEDLADHAFNQVTCDGGELELSTPGTVVRVIDPCERLVVSGAGSVVVAETVGELVVEIIAVVHVASASLIEVTSDAAGAHVTWGSGTPSVTNDAPVAVVQPADEL
ncbi:hypothetical protein [Salana multivorans]